MKFFEKIFQSETSKNKEDVKNLHPDFRSTIDNFWYFNRFYSGFDIVPTLKVVFKFDDPKLLDNCPFMTKIGINQSDGPKYFGVAFGNNNNRTELEKWTEKFNWAHLITDLDENGAMKEDSKEIDLKDNI